MCKCFSVFCVLALLRSVGIEEVKYKHHLGSTRRFGHLVCDFILDVNNGFDYKEKQSIYHII